MPAHHASRCLREGRLARRAIASLALLDRQLVVTLATQCIGGDLGEPATLARIAAFAPDAVFHLAAVPRGAAEADYA